MTQSIAKDFLEDPATAAYASSMEDLIDEGKPDLWIHGHVHHGVDYVLGQTRILCNPKGYLGENLDWNPAFSVVV